MTSMNRLVGWDLHYYAEQKEAKEAKDGSQREGTQQKWWGSKEQGKSQRKPEANNKMKEM